MVFNVPKLTVKKLLSFYYVGTIHEVIQSNSLESWRSKISPNIKLISNRCKTNDYNAASFVNFNLGLIFEASKNRFLIKSMDYYSAFFQKHVVFLINFWLTLIDYKLYTL